MFHPFHDAVVQLRPRFIVAVEFSQPDTGGQDAGQCRIELRFVEQARFDRFRNVAVRFSTIEIGSGTDGLGYGVLHVLVVAMPSRHEEVVNGPAVGNHQSLIAPFSAKQGIDQIGIRAAGNAAEAVVGNHHLLYVRFGHQILEGGKIGLPQVAFAYFCVETVPVPFRSGVDGEMLGAGVRLVHRRLRVALQPPDHGHAELSREIWVLSVGLHAASPARVAEDVDVGRPERKALVPAGLAGGQRLAVLDARLVAHGREHFFQKRFVEGSRHADGLRESGRLAVAGYAVQRLVPPVVGQDTH